MLSRLVGDLFSYKEYKTAPHPHNDVSLVNKTSSHIPFNNDNPSKIFQEISIYPMNINYSIEKYYVVRFYIIGKELKFKCYNTKWVII